MLSKHFYIFKDETSEEYLLYLDEFHTFSLKKTNVTPELKGTGEALQREQKGSQICSFFAAVPILPL